MHANTFLTRRPDGRTFVSIDTWDDDEFGRCARHLLASTPKPFYTVVEATDLTLLAQWQRAGLRPYRHELEVELSTSVRRSSADAALEIVDFGAAAPDSLTGLDQEIRRQVAQGLGWHRMPAETLRTPSGDVVDSSRYAVAVREGRYVGLLRVAGRAPTPRIGLVAVLAEFQGRGVATALLSHALGTLAHRSVLTAVAEIDVTNVAALSLARSFDAQVVGGAVELVTR